MDEPIDELAAAIFQQHLAPLLTTTPRVAAVLVRGEEVCTGELAASGDSSPAGCWEIGSITKALTGTLLADLVLAGEVALDDPIGRYLPHEVSRRLPTASRQPTLEDLATHHGGFASIPWRWLATVRGPNPYAHLTEDQVFAVLGPRTRRPSRPRFRYSNFGMGLLGHLLARAAGVSYEELLRDRVLDPMGMDQASVGACRSGAGPTVEGVRRGKPTPAWTFGALEACGGVRATTNDLIALALICLLDAPEGTNDPLTMAHQPRRRANKVDRVGLGWMIREHDGGRVVWHNGATYATSSFFAADRERQVAVALLGNAGPRLVPRLDAPGWAILGALAEP